MTDFCERQTPFIYPSFEGRREVFVLLGCSSVDLVIETEAFVTLLYMEPLVDVKHFDLHCFFEDYFKS